MAKKDGKVKGSKRSVKWRTIVEPLWNKRFNLDSLTISGIKTEHKAEETDGQYVDTFNEVIGGLEAHADAAESYRIRMIDAVQSQLEAEIEKRPLLCYAW
jgi:hypothetical protein